MKILYLYCLGVLVFISCNDPNIKNRLEKEDVRIKDSIASKKNNDLILARKFKKWISGNDTTYVPELFSKDFENVAGYLFLKPEPKILSAVIAYHFYEGHLLIYPSVTRYDSEIWAKFSAADLDNYENSSSFKVTVITSNNLSYQIFSKSSSDDELLKTVSTYIKYKIKVEEFFARIEVGRFEGAKKLPNKIVRAFYLSDENKQALKDTYQYYKLIKNE